MQGFEAGEEFADLGIGGIGLVAGAVLVTAKLAAEREDAAADGAADFLHVAHASAEAGREFEREVLVETKFVAEGKEYRLCAVVAGGEFFGGDIHFGGHCFFLSGF
ncbi:MAG: hypothetical protein NTY53_00340, partial [Kiritimatiellaeota bacterium]|nr:hypothetical protein [Kiritimatiellota bacterium]